MDDDELVQARKLVAAARPLRDQMRKDWGHHREPEEVLDQAVTELAAERDRLRAGIMDAEVHGELIVRMRESVWRDFEAERDRLRAEVAIQTNASDAAAEAVGLMAEKLSATLAENTRLRAVVDAARDLLAVIDAAQPDSDVFRLSGHRATSVLRGALDGSGVMGGPSVGDRATCRWCHEPIIFVSSTELAVAEDAWAHEGPQSGSGYDRQRACEPDMQSMLAEPAEIERCPNCGAGPEGNEDCPLCRALNQEPEPLRRLRELGEEAANQATPSDASIGRALQRVLDADQIERTFRCGHGRSGTEGCPMCDAGFEVQGVMCTSGDHEDVQAVGDALTDETDEGPNGQRYPYCGECLDTLGRDYEPHLWDMGDDALPDRRAGS